MGQPGFVYVLSNPAMQGLLKVGLTEKHPAERAIQLRTTGVPAAFEVLFAVYSADASELENRVHSRLKKFRYADDREFFECSPQGAIGVVVEEHETLCGSFCVEAVNRTESFYSVLRSFSRVVGVNDGFELSAALECLAPDEFTAAWSRHEAKKQRQVDDAAAMLIKDTESCPEVGH